MAFDVFSRALETLSSWGYDPQHETALRQMMDSRSAMGLCPARVVWQGRGEHEVIGREGRGRAVVAGRIRHEEAPVTGDWVALEPPGEGAEVRVIAGVLPRRTCLRRKGAGRASQQQVIAANVDVVVVVTSPDDLSLGRLVRYHEAVRRSGAEVVFVLNKVDSIACVDWAQRTVADVADGAPVVLASALRGDGVATLASALSPGRTLAVVGSSGVGKSSLVAALVGSAAPAIGVVRDRDGRGQHTTTTRQLWQVPGGGLLLDTPGMRELAPWSESEDPEEGLDALSQEHGGCRFRDCRHETEPGCALLHAIDVGTLAASVLTAHRKIAREEMHQARRRQARASARARRRR